MVRISKRSIINTLVSIGVSLLVLGLIVHLVNQAGGDISREKLVSVFKSTPLFFVGLYGLCLILQTVFRAARYNVLLAGGGEKNVPPFFHTLLVTATRNMLVDCLPARTGELSYVAMMNRGYRVGGDACITSLTVSTLLDFAALFMIVLVMTLFVLLTGELPAWLLFVLAGVTLIVVIGSVALFAGVRWVTLFCRRFTPGLLKHKIINSVFEFLEKTADSFSKIASKKTLFVSFLLSCGVRFFKYAGVYMVFLGVTSTLFPEMNVAPVWKVFSALLLAEVGASMPVPTFMSFGAYESAGLLAFTALGFAAADSTLVMFAIHVYSQVMDYGFGGLGFILFMFFRPDEEASREMTSPKQINTKRFLFAIVAILLVFVGAGLGFVKMHSIRKKGSSTPPPTGFELIPDSSIVAEGKDEISELSGFVVWSSSRTGNHELFLMNLPGFEIEQLTDNKFTDTYPRISPDGTKVVFCRSQTEWVSQRNPIPWDVYILDLESRKEKKLAENGNTPVWIDNVSVGFQRSGDEFVQCFLETGEETTLFKSGEGSIPSGCQLQTPSYNSISEELGVTLRGRRRMTSLFSLSGGILKMGNGCQLTWEPDGRWLYSVESKGKVNQFVKHYPQSGKNVVWFAPVGEYNHAYFPKLSNNSEWLVYGASSSGHEHDTADYEIFLWRVDDPPESAIRLTWHTSNDCWPDIYIYLEP